MPRISDDSRRDRRRQIANAAMRCFVRKGFEATSMADIIAEAGISAGAIYVHYENKQELVRQVVSDVLAERAGELTDLPKRVPIPSPVEFVSDFMERVRAGSGADIRIHMWSTCLREPSLAEVFDAYTIERLQLCSEYVRAWLLQCGLAPEDAAARATPLAEIVIALCQGYVVRAALVPDLEPDAYLAGLRLLDFAPRTPSV